MNFPARIWKRWRYGTRWWIRWITYPVVTLILFYVIEDTRGWFALNKAKAAYLATGRSLDIDEILGPMPLDEDNFGAADFIVELYENKQDSDPFPGFERLPVLWEPDSPPAKKMGYRMPITLPEYFVEKGVSPSSRIGQELLRKLSPYSSAMGVIEQAAHRPKCRYPGTLNWSSNMYHLELVHNAIRNFQYRAVGNHLARNFDESLSDLITLGCLVDHVGKNEGLVGTIISIAVRNMELDTIWYLLENQGWNEEQLKALKHEIERRSTAAKLLERALNIQTAIFVTELDRLNHERVEATNVYSSTVSFSGFRLLPHFAGADFLEPFLVKGLIFFAPRGWWWQNEAAYLNSTTGTASLTADVSPYTFLVSISTISILPLENKALNTDITAQLAILAIDLERHKLTHGRYPGDLSGFNTHAEKYGYQLGGNGRPIIYFDKSGIHSQPIPERDFESWKHAHLWLYP